jgi:hypothetical protein
MEMASMRSIRSEKRLTAQLQRMGVVLRYKNGIKNLAAKKNRQAFFVSQAALQRLI